MPKQKNTGNAEVIVMGTCLLVCLSLAVWLAFSISSVVKSATQTREYASRRPDLSVEQLVGNLFEQYDREQTSTQIPCVVVFSDYQCPACIIVHDELENIKSEQGSGVLFLQRHFPLAQHKQAYAAACLAESATTLSQYESLNRFMYAQHGELSPASLRRCAVKAGVNPPNLSNGATALGAKRVNADIALGRQIGIKQIPAIFFCDASGVREVGSTDTLRLLLSQRSTREK